MSDILSQIIIIIYLNIKKKLKKLLTSNNTLNKINKRNSFEDYFFHIVENGYLTAIYGDDGVENIFGGIWVDEVFF
jgi:hypothetical protein